MYLPYVAYTLYVRTVHESVCVTVSCMGEFHINWRHL